MKKVILPFISSVIIFILIILLPIQLPIRQTYIHVELSGYIIEDDVFQLFYSTNEADDFSLEQSINKEIKGSSSLQTIKFAIPANIPIRKIRIDIGGNNKQKPMVLNPVRFNYLDLSYEYSLFSSFIANSYVVYENGKYITHADSEFPNTYDPYFISNINFASIFPNYKNEQTLKWKFILALLFSVITFVILFKQQLSWLNLISNLYLYLFLLVLLAPTLVDFLHMENDFTIEEKRELTVKPKLAFTKDFAQQYENYYNDNFAMRSILIKWASFIKVELFKVSSKPELVQVGKNGFLFYNIVDDYSNTRKYSKQDLENLFQKQTKIKDSLSEKGIKYILAFWPNKHSIYSENFPMAMQMQVVNDSSLSCQVINYFNKQTTLIFDVRNDLLKAKSKAQLYCKFDTHWNERGAYEAYKAFCTQTYSQLGLKPFDIDQFSTTYNKVYTGDLTSMLGIDSISSYSDQMPTMVLKDSSKNYKMIDNEGFPSRTIITLNENCDNKTVVLVYRDSFFSSLLPFLSLHYYKIVYIWSYPLESYPVDREEIISKVKPNIVINSSVERLLPELLQ